MNDIKLSIIIVSYNTKKLIQQCLDSIMLYLSSVEFEIIIVDNNSSDSSQDLITQYCKKDNRIKSICLDSNLGFGKANNEGLKIANGKNVLFLNSDTYFIDSSIIQLIEWLDRKEDAFGCGCLLLNPDLSNGVSYGMFPELLTVAMETVLNKFCHFRAITPQKTDIKEIDFPCGAFFLVKRQLLDIIGFFDDRFFLYFEETDLAKRAKNAGYKIYFYGKARVVHIGGASESRRSPFITSMNYESWRKYLIKHQGVIATFIVNKILLTYFYVKIIYAKLLNKKSVLEHFNNECNGLKAGWKEK